MRAVGQADGVSVKAYAGTTGVILAFDVAADKREGLLGFAIQRSGGNRPTKWLSGSLSFPGVERKPGVFATSDVAPIQKFRWSDYTVFPDTTYTYEVHPVYGTPSKLRLDPGPAVTVMTSSVTRGDHRVVFNRAAAASQAFSRDFPEVEEELERGAQGEARRGHAAARAGMAQPRRARADHELLRAARSIRRGRWTSRSTSTSCTRSATRSTPPATAARTCGSSTTPSHATRRPCSTRSTPPTGPRARSARA